MWNKIYPVILAVAVLAMGVLLYLPYSWLQSVTAPKDVAGQYQFYSNISWIFLLISSLILLVLGNVVLWLTRQSWAMWAALLYFAVFMIAYTFWLENSFFRYKQANNFESGIISWSPLVGVILIVLAAIIVFFNQFIVKRMHDKTYPAAAQPVEESLEKPISVETAADDKNV